MTKRFSNKFFVRFLLPAILVVAAVIRLWQLNTNPPSLTPDEAALGYNAYSILKTGKDEWGKFLPIIFKSFGDYKPGLYIYATVPFVAIFGLGELSVRLASAISGIASVWLVYKIVSFMVGEKESKLAVVAAGLLALSPWHIQFSRGAWEVNLSLFLTLLGILFFLQSFENVKYLLLSSVFFALTLFAYQGAKMSTLIVLFVLTISFWKKTKDPIVKKNLKIFLLSLSLGFLIALPTVFSMFRGETGRLTVFSVFSYPRPKEYLQAMLDQNNEKVGDMNYFLFHNETYNFLRGIMGRWFNHFSTSFLFFVGDWSNPRHSPPYQGVLTLFDIFLLVCGFIGLSKKDSLNPALKRFVVLWLILSPLPAALSRDQVHAVRSFNMVIPLIIILAFGVVSVLSFLTKQKPFLKNTSYLVLIGYFLVSYIYFLDSCFVHQPKQNSKYWDYGYRQVVEEVFKLQPNYKTIKVQQSFAQPYIYFLFYDATGDFGSQRFDVSEHQKNSKLVSSEYEYDVGYVTNLGNIEFVPIDWSANRGESETLFVADPIRIPPDDSKDGDLFDVIKEIYYLNGRDIAFRIVAVK